MSTSSPSLEPASSEPTPSKNGPSSFLEFDLDGKLQHAIAVNGFEAPRPIQAQTIPAAIEGRDILGLAQTGTGKTAAFALPILDRILSLPGMGPRALVLAPTRELAMQIESDFKALAQFTKVKTTLIYGGVSAKTQIKALKQQPHVVVACPGRLLDLYQQKAFKTGRIETLVLDEADQMFDMGFLPDISKIVSTLPENRQNLLFSATMPKEVRHLANSILNDPLRVELAHTRPAETIEHALYPVADGKKRELLEQLIHTDGVGSALVFTRTKFRASKLAKSLGKSGFRAIALQGNMTQNQRDRAMKGFRNGKFDILVATDIVSRGIDVEQISHVFNYDVPATPEAYTHRIGRTGRAERQGKAYTLVTIEDLPTIKSIERKLKAPIPQCYLEGFDPIDFSTQDQVFKSNVRRKQKKEGPNIGKQIREGKKKKRGQVEPRKKPKLKKPRDPQPKENIELDPQKPAPDPSRKKVKSKKRRTTPSSQAKKSSTPRRKSRPEHPLKEKDRQSNREKSTEVENTSPRPPRKKKREKSKTSISKSSAKKSKARRRVKRKRGR